MARAYRVLPVMWSPCGRDRSGGIDRLTADADQAQMWLDEGFKFVAVGVDTVVLTRGVDALAKRFLG